MNLIGKVYLDDRYMQDNEHIVLEQLHHTVALQNIVTNTIKWEAINTLKRKYTLKSKK